MSKAIKMLNEIETKIKNEGKKDFSQLLQKQKKELFQVVIDYINCCAGRIDGISMLGTQYIAAYINVNNVSVILYINYNTNSIQTMEFVKEKGVAAFDDRSETDLSKIERIKKAIKKY